MLKCKFCVVCEVAVRDAESEALSIINIIETVQAASFPLFIQKLFFVATCERDISTDPERQRQLFFIRVNDTELFRQEIELDFRDKKGTRVILHLNGIAIPTDGRLRFQLGSDENPLCSYEVSLVAVDADGLFHS